MSNINEYVHVEAEDQTGVSRVRIDSTYLDVGASAVTAATATEVVRNVTRSGWSKFTWSNAMVAALGAVKTGNVKAFTVAKGTIVKDAYVVIGTAETHLTDLTVSLGRTGTAYEDYIAAANAQATAGTIYGNAALERGASLTGFDLASLSASTDYYLQFITTDSGHDLADALASTGTVYVLTERLPGV